MLISAVSDDNDDDDNKPADANKDDVERNGETDPPCLDVDGAMEITDGDDGIDTDELDEDDDDDDEELEDGDESHVIACESGSSSSSVSVKSITFPAPIVAADDDPDADTDAPLLLSVFATGLQSKTRNATVLKWAALNKTFIRQVPITENI